MRNSGISSILVRALLSTIGFAVADQIENPTPRAPRVIEQRPRHEGKREAARRLKQMAKRNVAP